MDAASPAGRGGEGLGVFGRQGTGGRLSVCDIKCQAEPEKSSHPDVF